MTDTILPLAEEYLARENGFYKVAANIFAQLRASS